MKVKKLQNRNELILVSSNFSFSLFPLLISANNDGKSFTNKLKNIALNVTLFKPNSCVKWLLNFTFI